MTPRIRTIKPDFFKHENLFDAERETGLSLRVAFAGLWTVADREGRFEWRPRRLKAEIMPYDDVDFSRVLDALTTRGFVVQYEVGGDVFGCIPSWHKHQVINNRESASTLPQPPEIKDQSDACSTRATRVTDLPVHALVEGKGREVKKDPHPPKGGASRFEEFWTAYPHRGKLPDPKKPALEKFERKVRDGIDPETIIEGAKRYADLVRSEMIEDRFVTTALVWLNQERWEAAKVEEPITAEEQAALDAARKGKPVIRVVAENLSADDDMPDIPEFLRRA